MLTDSALEPRRFLIPNPNAELFQEMFGSYYKFHWEIQLSGTKLASRQFSVVRLHTIRNLFYVFGKTVSIREWQQLVKRNVFGGLEEAKKKKKVQSHICNFCPSQIVRHVHKHHPQKYFRLQASEKRRSVKSKLVHREEVQLRFFMS